MSSKVPVLNFPKGQYTLENLPQNFLHIPQQEGFENGKISVVGVGEGGRERFWAEILVNGQVAPAGNRDQASSVHDYVTKTLAILNVKHSPGGSRNLVGEFYREKEIPILRIYNWTFTATDCYCIGCMLITLICVSVTIGFLMTMPCPLL